MVISEKVRARVKRTKFWDHLRKKTYSMNNFHFWSCDLENSAVFVENNAYLGNSKSESETGKILGSPKEKNIFDNKM